MSKARMMIWTVLMASVLGGSLGLPALAENLTIYDVQYTTAADGASPYANQVLSQFAGGIVIHKYPGFDPKLTLYDPSHPDGWGGVVVKDFTTNKSMFNTVSVGDFVSFTSLKVEEYRGSTVLRYEAGSGNTSGYTIVSSGNLLPAPKLVSANEIPAPVDGKKVADHRAEKYEAMLLKIEDVGVTLLDQGKAADNYKLTSASGDAWAADYMASDLQGGYYLPQVALGAQFASVTGILEQYTKDPSWDYYQLLTRGSADLVAVPEPSTAMLLLSGLFLAGLWRRWPRSIAQQFSTRRQG